MLEGRSVVAEVQAGSEATNRVALRLRECMYVCMCACMYVCMYCRYVHVCMYVCMQVTLQECNYCKHFLWMHAALLARAVEPENGGACQRWQRLGRLRAHTMYALAFFYDWEYD